MPYGIADKVSGGIVWERMLGKKMLNWWLISVDNTP